jgi:hypothetical protein
MAAGGLLVLSEHGGCRRRPAQRWTLAILVLASFPPGVLAQETPPELTPESRPQGGTTVFGAVGKELERYWHDTGYVLTSPFRWDGKEWMIAGVSIASLAIVGTQDERIDQAVSSRKTSRSESFAKAVTPFGQEYAIAFTVATLGTGLVFKNAEIRDTGRDALEAELIAAGIVTPVLKKVFGRERPIEGSDGDEYQAFASGDNSFPSGHATMAFALASVLSARSKGWIVPVISYSLAGSVAFARVHDRAHFASDVMAGALIGTLVGRSVVHRHMPEEGKISWMIVPVQTKGGAGIGIRFETGGP